MTNRCDRDPGARQWISKRLAARNCDRIRSDRCRWTLVRSTAHQLGVDATRRDVACSSDFSRNDRFFFPLHSPPFPSGFFSFFIPPKLTTIDRTDNTPAEADNNSNARPTKHHRNRALSPPYNLDFTTVRLDARARMRIIHTSRWFALIGRATNRHSIREQPFYARNSSLYRYDYRYVRCKGYNCYRMRSIFRSTWITRCFIGQVSTSEPFISKTAQTS